LVWVGPSWGLGSGAAFKTDEPKQNTFDAIVWFSTLLREARITLYSFSVGEIDPGWRVYLDFISGVKSAQDATSTNLNRKVLAVQSGGRVLEPSRDLSSQINDCIREADVFYTLSFDPSHAEHPDEFHNLRVRIGSPGLTARSVTGYYDQPYYSEQANLATKGVTVEQLKKILSTTQGNSDAEVGQLLEGFELKEQLSDSTFASLQTSLHGAKGREALVTLSDASAFREVPITQIPTIAPPDLSEQRRMLTRTIEYLNETLTRLPNFFATRDTARYEESPPKYERAGQPGTAYLPLHLISSSMATVLYRDGREVVDVGARKNKDLKAEDRYLSVHGTFGPILSMVMSDTAVSGFTWSHWEGSATVRRAIFRYVVPADKSHYEIVNCCLPDDDATAPPRVLTGYHGEIAIDPTSGAILRLEVQADLKPTLAVVKADIMVEYTPVDIGGKSYMCPVRAVYVSRGRTVRDMHQWQSNFTTVGPFVTKLNDVSFGEYHMFRGDSQMLPGFNIAPGDKAR
jgi:hypothetical protein